MKLLLDNSAEGSTDLEEADNITTSSTPSDHQPTTPDLLLGQVADFMRHNMFLVVVAVASLVLIVLLVFCGAVYLTRRRKLNAYFPSSYPAKMYVDQRDKSGGASGFYELPEKAAAAAAASDRETELTDSHKQLHADIVRAAKSLRTPTKTREDASESDKRETSPPPPPPGLVVGKAGEAVGPSPGGGAAAEKPEDETQEAPTSKNLRPPSLHLHNDSATLQLIAGEKTAF
ncbi:transmembrane protein 119b [Festucalex cinctus]